MKSKSDVGRVTIPLVGPNIHCRVRPLAVEGAHSAHGEKVYKSLSGYSPDGLVTLEDSHGSVTYKFPKSVLGPDCTQNEVYKSLAAENVASFVKFGGYNSLIFAYGQTGTGKTYTIFGPEESWNSPGTHEVCGILPRVVADVFRMLENEEFILTVGAMEFYMLDVFDLLDPTNKRLLINPDDGFPMGLYTTEIKSPEDVIPLCYQIRSKRSAASTRMNAAYGGHGGSSRSHAAIMLTLRRKDSSSNRVCTTVMNIVDLAGAERPSSNGNENMGVFEAYMAYHRGEYENLHASQGSIVNYELSFLRTAIVNATAVHKQRKVYKPPRQMATAFTQYASGCITGINLLSMIVTLSQAPSCGWETWFSCQYGEDLAALRVPVTRCKIYDGEKMLKAAREVLESARASLKRTIPSGHPTSKFYHRRTLDVTQYENQYEYLQRLCSQL